MFGRELIRADCRRCCDPRTPEKDLAMIRAENGCDTEATRAVWRAPCGCDAHPACTDCGGKGYIAHHRCPGVMARGSEDFARAWAHYNARNTLPCAGGLLDQTAAFVDACAIMDSHRAHWDDEHRERAERERKQ